MQPNDPLYANQWHLRNLGNIEKIWDEYSGAGVHVGIYDSGVETTHPDLAAGYDPTRQFVYNGTPESGDVDTTNQTDPLMRGHGTAVAGIIAARADDGVGGVGIAWGSTFTSVNIDEYLFRDPVGGADKLIASLEHQAAFDVVNNSWNRVAPHYLPSDNATWAGTFVSREIGAFALASATGRNGLGTVIVQGAGNDNVDIQGNGLDTTRFTITVGATGADGFAASYSSYGASLLVTAPGGDGGDGIVTTDLSGTDGFNLAADPGGASAYTDRFDGTSASSAVVTGVVALMLEANPNLGWRDVQNILAASATHTGSAIGALTPGINENGNWFLNGAGNWNGGGMHFSNDYGYGLVDAYNAVRMAEVWSLFQPAQTSANEQSKAQWNWNQLAIADHGVIEDSLTLTTPAGMRVEHVDVVVDFKHQDFTDLRIFLISPEGTKVQLYDGSGGNDTTADSELRWTFGADALHGELAAGQWRLRIEDADTGNTGTYYGFQVQVFGEQTTADATARDDVYHYTDEFLAMQALAGESGRASLADAGGTDWIDAAAVTGNFVLDLRAGQTSSVDGAAWFTIAAGTSIENAVTGDGDDTITGNAAANILMGMRGNDTLDGGAGSDMLNGGVGNDTYVLGSEASGLDTIVDASGVDTIVTAISRSLAFAGYAAVENLTLLDGISAAVTLTGNDLANVLTGNAFANTLDGGDGGDTLNGGAGDDTYVLGSEANGVDTIVDASGVDTIVTAISRSLAFAGYSGIENLTLLDGVSAAVTLTGNDLANVLTGNSFANSLSGGAGSDTLIGGAGNDTYVLDAEATGVDTIVDSSGLDTIVTTVSRSLAFAGYSGIENLWLLDSAPAAANTLTGNDLANVLTGNDAANTLDGRAGADTLRGGTGNDTYVLAAEATGVDTIIDTGGVDTITTTVGRSLAFAGYSAIENLTLLGVAAATLTGNNLANILTGNSAANTLDGGAGSDTLNGGAGNDTYVLGGEASGIDAIIDAGGVDTVTTTIGRSLAFAGYSAIENLTLLGAAAAALTGNNLANVLTGNSSANTLDGGAGADTLNGGAGNDTYVLGADATGVDTIVDTGGVDTIVTTVGRSLAFAGYAAIENLTLVSSTTSAPNSSGAASALTGNGLVNVLTGNNLANTLDGGKLGDTMTGLGGNDVYVVDNALDKVSEAGGNGTDTVRASVSFSLANAARVLGAVENLALINVAAALNGTGNRLNNSITGNGFNNALLGGGGNDTLSGAGGNDRVSGDTGDDVLSGGAGNDTLSGMAGNDGLLGDAGDDVLNGGDGNDGLSGGAGADVLTGGAGRDMLTGGAGNDFFVFSAPLSAAHGDVISDFANVAGNNDTIRLENAVMPRLGAGVGALNAQFFWNGPAAHDANDYVVYNRATGSLSYDSNGSGAGGMTLLAVLTNKPVLTAADFVVI